MAKQIWNPHGARKDAEVAAFTADQKAKFWTGVRKSEFCWIYERAIRNQGYGVYYIGRNAYSAHRVSLILSVGMGHDGALACHRCNVFACVRPDHLYWGTSKSNNDDTKRANPKHFLHEHGERHPKAKLTDDQAKEIYRKFYCEDVTYKELAKEYNVSDGAIAALVRGQSWKHQNLHLEIIGKKARKRISTPDKGVSYRSVDEVLDVWHRFHSSNESTYHIARELSMHPSTVSSIVQRRQWRGVTDGLKERTVNRRKKS